MNIIDTGHVDFTIEVNVLWLFLTLRLLFLNASAGVERKPKLWASG
jgi:translation elongation factor EF-G